MTDDDAQLLEHGRLLAEAVVDALPGWVERCVRLRCTGAGVDYDTDVADATRRAGVACVADVGAAVSELLATDPDEQTTTPLALIRSAVVHPGAVLVAAGVPPVDRDDFARRSFPDDVYDLSPATVADLDPGLHELAITWGAARAWVHRRRHGGGE
ncbi:MAG: hypothetical protein FJW94_05600 [Actinobacteria bacterium]|nr:hypothetical protein [Actinomycetota bacterium]